MVHLGRLREECVLIVAFDSLKALTHLACIAYRTAARSGTVR